MVASSPTGTSFTRCHPSGSCPSHPTLDTACSYAPRAGARDPCARVRRADASCRVRVRYPHTSVRQRSRPTGTLGLPSAHSPFGTHLVHLDRSADPLQADLVDRRAVDELLDLDHRALGDQDLTRLGAVRQPRGQIHLVPEHRVVAASGRSDIADRDPARRDPDPDLERLAVLAQPCLVQIEHALAHLQTHPHGSFRVIGLRDRIAKEHHQRVAHVFVERSTVTEHDLGHLARDSR